MKQYEIWWAALPEPVGRRPVLLLTRTPAYGYLHQVMIVEITTTIRGIPQEVSLGADEGLGVESVANFDHVHVVPKRMLEARIGRLGRSREVEAKRALGRALGWPDLQGL